jgi:hypothetical protein
MAMGEKIATAAKMGSCKEGSKGAAALIAIVVDRHL